MSFPRRRESIRLDKIDTRLRGYDSPFSKMDIYKDYSPRTPRSKEEIDDDRAY